MKNKNQQSSFIQYMLSDERPEGYINSPLVDDYPDYLAAHKSMFASAFPDYYEHYTQDVDASYDKLLEPYHMRDKNAIGIGESRYGTTTPTSTFGYSNTGSLINTTPTTPTSPFSQPSTGLSSLSNSSSQPAIGTPEWYAALDATKSDNNTTTDFEKIGNNDLLSINKPLIKSRPVVVSNDFLNTPEFSQVDNLKSTEGTMDRIYNFLLEYAEPSVKQSFNAKNNLYSLKMPDENKHKYVSCIGATGGTLAALETLGGGLLNEGGDIVNKLFNAEKRNRYGGTIGVLNDSIKDMKNNGLGIFKGYFSNSPEECEEFLPKEYQGHNFYK